MNIVTRVSQICKAGPGVYIRYTQCTYMAYMYGVHAFLVYFGHKTVGNVRWYTLRSGVYCRLGVYCQMNFIEYTNAPECVFQQF